MAASNMSEELLEFLSENATSKSPVMIPASPKKCFMSDEDLATTPVEERGWTPSLPG